MGAGLARFASRNVTAGSQQLFVSKVVDYTSRGTSPASIDFWIYRDSIQASSSDSLTIWINTTDTLNTSAIRLGAVARNKTTNLPNTESIDGWYNYTFTVTGTDATGCMASTTVNVAISNPPTLTMSATPGTLVCKGQQVVLNCVQEGPGTNGFTYLWSDGTTTRRDTVIFNNDITYTVIVTNAAGCSSTDSISITVDTSATVDFTWTQTGSTFAFTDITSGGSNQIWDFGDGNGSTNAQPTYTYSGYSDFTVTLTTTGNCGTYTITHTISIWPLGFNNIAKKYFSIYPNPTSKDIYITATESLKNTIALYNALGKKLQEIKIINKENKVDISGLAKGVYYFKYLNQTQKFTIQ